MQTRRQWILSALAWDSFLPPVVVLLPAIFAVVLPGREFIAILFGPICAAIFRASIAMRQLTAVYGSHPSWLRQTIVAIAISLLLIFELLAGVLVCAAGVPRWAWAVAAALYLVYLAFILAALRPRTEQFVIG
jgi:hypothetical protein